MDGADRLLSGLRALELRRELLDAACRVDDALLTGVGGMRVGSHIAQDDVELLAIDLLLASRLERRLGEEFATGRDVDETDVVKGGMAFGFHGEMV